MWFNQCALAWGKSLKPPNDIPSIHPVYVVGVPHDARIPPTPVSKDFLIDFDVGTYMGAKEIGLRPPLNSCGIANGHSHYVWAIHRYIYTKDVCLKNDQGIDERRLLKKKQLDFHTSSKNSACSFASTTHPRKKKHSISRNMNLLTETRDWRTRCVKPFLPVGQLVCASLPLSLWKAVKKKI